MKLEELRRLSIKQLEDKKAELELELIKSKSFFGSQFKKAERKTGAKKGDNVKLASNIRKSIARINTIIREKNEPR